MNSSDGDLKHTVKNYENNMLLRQLKEVEEGRLTKEELARKLEISRFSLYRKINRMKEMENIEWGIEKSRPVFA